MKRAFAQLAAEMLPTASAGARKAEAGLTKDRPGRHGLSVQPERHLGEDDGHDAGQVSLDDKITDFSLQVKMSRHYCIFT